MFPVLLSLFIAIFQLPPVSKHLTVLTSTSAHAAAPGSKLSLYVDVTPNPGIHVYAPGAKDYLPVALDVASTPNVTFRSKRFGKAESMEFEGQKVPVFSKTFRITQDVELGATLASGETVTLNGTLKYQACDDKVCFIPASVPLTWTIAVK